MQLSSPLCNSTALVVTSTSLVYQPFAPSVPVGASDTVGASLSSLTLNVALPTRPAALVQVPGMSTPTASVFAVCVKSGEQLTTGLTRSVPVVRMVGSVMYQPLLPSCPVITVMVT